MDSITANKQRLAYAKICIEKKASMEVPKFIDVERRDGSIMSVSVEIPWMPQKCKHCCIFGHNDKTRTKTIKIEAMVWVPKYKGNMAMQEAKMTEVDELQPDSAIRKNEVLIALPTARAGSVNRFSILEALQESELVVDEGSVHQSSKNEAEEIIPFSPRKQRAVAAGVADLMKALKNKKKGPVDKGKKVKAEATASGCKPSCSST
ncbi:uncharacterized protein LOC111288229 [Durio zibethinus]|uniref:Uncharacterized protein LOC111288229 n=1 Tax=Durio zibethinus TaxID=66656 RepID=A0A6P5Y2Y3_DURZI|nr:uncharacterized protein LOC111288229 [Durio zibethinus]XP_022734765.1 uncharacterized protein LOC111288229 [Durio zibethinus]